MSVIYLGKNKLSYDLSDQSAIQSDWPKQTMI